jgi:zinc protease
MARTPTLRGSTTGVRSGFDRRRSAGPLALGTAAQSDKTAEALAEVLGELGGLRTAVPADELAVARSEVALEFSKTFEATGRISSRLQALETLVTFDLPDDYYSTYARAIQAVTAADVQRVATSYLQPEHLVIAVAGDRRSIEPRLRALDIAPLTIVAVDDLFAAAK